jgi:hypothetical protein
MRAALLSSSRDFLQGTSEKIYFQRFLCQQPLQLFILVFQLPRLPVCRGPLITQVGRARAPVIQQALIDP